MRNVTSSTSETNSPTFGGMPRKRPPLALLRRGASVVPSPEIHWASSSLESVFSFHQQSIRTAFLFGKNNVLAFTGEREAPGYLSLYHDQNRLPILKWIPNWLLLSKPGSTTNAVKSPNHNACCAPVSIRFETISHLHLHRRDGALSTTIVLIDSDGVQQFCFSFSLEQHCFSFLMSLEGALSPLFKIDPPLNSIKIGGRSFVTLNGTNSLTLFQSTDSQKGASVVGKAGPSELVFRIISFASPSFEQKVTAENESVPFSLSSTQEAKCEDEGKQKTSLRETLSTATKAMQSQILARAFIGWLTYSQHLRKIRLNLASIVTIEGFVPDSNGMDLPVNEVFWRICRSEKTIVLFKQFLTRVYFCGVEPTLRAHVWPYLLRLIEWHEEFGRPELDAIGAAYRRDLEEWTEMEKELAQQKGRKGDTTEEESLCCPNSNDIPMFVDKSSSALNGSLSARQSEGDAIRHCPPFGSTIHNDMLGDESGVHADKRATREQAKAFSKEFGDNLLRIKKDVERCDRTTKFYSCHDNLDTLQRIICTYIYRRLKLNLEDGYVQGMCDLVAPLLVVFEDEALTMACFERMMLRMGQNFPKNTQNNGMEENLNNFRSLVEVMDPELYCQLMRNIDYSFVVFYRWLLLDFKRELVYSEVFQLWEVIWAAEMSCSRHFELFFGLALLTQYRDVLIENEMDFTDVIKFFNEMAEKHNADDLLNIARQKLHTFQEIMCNLKNTPRHHPPQQKSIDHSLAI